MVDVKKTVKEVKEKFNLLSKVILLFNINSSDRVVVRGVGVTVLLVK